MESGMEKRLEQGIEKAIEGEVNYAGFWIRLLASLIDSVLSLIVLVPLMNIFLGGVMMSGTASVDPAYLLLNYLLPALAVILFWVYKSATPGKMLLRLQIVDADTGGKPTLGQLVGRYLAYFISAFPLCLGFVWVGLDKRKQGWHDKLAGTLVIRVDR